MSLDTIRHNRATDPNYTSIVVGGARGVGHAMVKQMLAKTSGNVVATCRKNPATDQELA